MLEHQKIKAVRERLDLTQQEVANNLGVSKQYLSKVELGLTNLSKSKLKLFCETYKVSYDWMFGDGPNMFQQQDEYVKQLFAGEEGYDSFGHLIDAYNYFIINIKAFIEKKHPDALFEKKLATACSMFYQYLPSGKIPLVSFEAEEWIKNKLKEKEFQDEVLETYYQSFTIS